MEHERKELRRYAEELGVLATDLTRAADAADLGRLGSVDNLDSMANSLGILGQQLQEIVDSLYIEGGR